ncbi:MAG: hypothetical protein WD396_09665 [Pseudohongiellaceae bacterium]
MKTTTLTLMTMALLLLGATSAHADDRDGRYIRGDSDGWRLGERVRDGYAIYRRSGRGWYRVPGSAIDLADGWALGSRRESGGYAIYRWNGRGWDQAPGGAVEIGGSYRRPWVINNRGQRYLWNGYEWRPDYGFHQPRDKRYARGFGRDRDDRDRDRDRRQERRDSWRDWGRDNRRRDHDYSRGRRRSDW